MVTKNELKRLRSLQQKKFRQEYRMFVVEGTKSVLELLESGWEVEGLYATVAWMEAHTDLNLPDLQIVSEKECEMASGLQTPPGIMACARFREPDGTDSTQSLPDKLLLLDGIRDCGNLGTIIRTADWFGFTHIICSEDTAELYNPKTIQASMGSFTRVRLNYTKLPEFISSLPEAFRIYGTFMEGQDLRGTEFPQHAAVVIGNEAHGISPEVEQMVTDRLSIVRVADHPVDSLNAAVATAILCFALSK